MVIVISVEASEVIKTNQKSSLKSVLYLAKHH